ncbi:MAG: hypothetical protein H6668_20845 [Ardenticatenaceae bacterium]|nr:hypothetical protein [Ardenticatenaceae bacterium]
MPKPGPPMPPSWLPAWWSHWAAAAAPCLASACSTLAGKTLPDQQLNDVALLVVLTGEQKWLQSRLGQPGCPSKIAPAGLITTQIAQTRCGSLFVMVSLPPHLNGTVNLPFNSKPGSPPLYPNLAKGVPGTRSWHCLCCW